jgi:sec-independent protein translocase protein TatA
MRAFEPWHLLVLLVVVLVLFGGKKLPDLTRGVAQSMRIFKKEIKRGDDEPTPPPSSAAPSRPEPLEGRVVDGDTGRTTPGKQQRHDV